MGYVKLALFVALGAFGITIFRTVSNIFEVPPVPKLEEIWWGPNPTGKQDTEIIPFKINIPDEVLKDLRYRLKNTKPLPSPLEVSKQSYGINSQLTTKIVDYWLNKYDWREREKLLNRYPQFKTDIQGLKMHFLHVKPKEHVGLKVLPLLLIHGWPGSVVEFYDIIPYLTTPQKGRNFVFEVIAPSLPGIGIYKITHHHTIHIPKLEETWWGIGPPSDEDNSIEAFDIIFPDEAIEDLRYRLKHVRPLPRPLENVRQSYGVNSHLTMRIVDYWLNKYNWTEREKYLNQYTHYKTKIQGLNIHFLHVKPKQENELKVIPLLLVHGWPSSIVEFYDIITHMTTPQKGYDFVFEVIAPSLPGYGFSDGASRPGLGVTQTSMIFKNLMKRLNFERFLVAGGDWGAILASHMSILFPENIIGMHSSMCLNVSPSYFLKKILYNLRPSLIVEKKYEHLAYPISVILPKILEEIGYVLLQATKPETLGVALTDSPSGLAVYIIEKILSLSNPNWKNTDVTNLTEKFNTDVLIDNVMIYWVTGTITSSMRLFSEAIHKTESALLDRFPVRAPAACARFIQDLFYNPVALLEDKYVNLLQVTDNEGGHFPALESPYVLALDIYAFTEKVLRLNDKK